MHCIYINCIPANIYIFKVSNRNFSKRSEICPKLTIKTPERSQWRRSLFFIVNFKHILHLFCCFYCWLWTGKCFLGWFIESFFKKRYLNLPIDDTNLNDLNWLCKLFNPFSWRTWFSLFFRNIWQDLKHSLHWTETMQNWENTLS